jgi:hypothetical protein
MAATFACPHCGATYPVKPVLVGRAVRCTACKKPFRLREDGIADAIAEPPVPAVAPAPAAPPAPEPAPPAPVVVEEPTARAVPTPVPQPSTERRSQRVRASAAAVNEDLRRSMASTLTTALGDAIKAEEKKPQSERIAKPTGPAQKAIGPAILTGEGERLAAEHRRWWLATGAVTAALAAVLWLALRRDEVETALAGFTAAVERTEADAAGGRIPAIQRRGWVVPSPAGLQIDPFVELRGLRRGGVAEVALGPVLGQISGKAWFAPAEAWVDAGRLDEAATAWEARPETKALFARASLAAVSHRSLRTALDALGSGNARLVEGLLLQPAVPGRPSLAAAVAAGRIPDRLQISRLNGDDGWLLMATGSSHKTTQGIAFHGTLVRMPDLDPGWRLAELRAGDPPVE